jgi:hypothetical protein
MNTVQEIKKAILNLNPQEIRQLDKWLQDFREKLRTRQNGAAVKTEQPQ